MSFFSSSGPKIAAAFQVPANVFTQPRPPHALHSIGLLLPLAALQPITARYANMLAVHASFLEQGCRVRMEEHDVKGKTKGPITAWKRERSEGGRRPSSSSVWKKATLYPVSTTRRVNESHKSGNSFHWEERPRRSSPYNKIIFSCRK